MLKKFALRTDDAFHEEIVSVYILIWIPFSYCKCSVAYEEATFYMASSFLYSIWSVRVLLPIALLMNEHGIIKLMIDSIKEKGEEASKRPKQALTSEFVDIAVDFFRIYTDRCHHGKEESILFRELAKKQISADHKKTMDELITEHIYARETVNALAEAQRKFNQRNQSAFAEIQTILKRLAEFYPKHIEKENDHFFYPCMQYFTDQELENMVEEFLRFDANIIHIRYIETVERLVQH